MKVIEVHEENHGLICIAVSKKSAFQYLIKHDWITPEYDLYDEATGMWHSLREEFEKKGVEPTKENILEWAMGFADDFMFWDGSFYFYETDVYEEE